MRRFSARCSSVSPGRGSFRRGHRRRPPAGRGGSRARRAVADRRADFRKHEAEACYRRARRPFRCDIARHRLSSLPARASGSGSIGGPAGWTSVGPYRSRAGRAAQNTSSRGDGPYHRSAPALHKASGCSVLRSIRPMRNQGRTDRLHRDCTRLPPALDPSRGGELLRKGPSVRSSVPWLEAIPADPAYPALRFWRVLP